MLSLAPRSALIISRKASTRAALLHWLVGRACPAARARSSRPSSARRTSPARTSPRRRPHKHADDHQKPEKCRHLRLQPARRSRLSPYGTAIQSFQGRGRRAGALDAIGLFMCIRPTMSENRGQSRAVHEPAGDKQVQLLRRLGPRSIVFVGLMGAGKTAIGRKVAAALGLPLPTATMRSRQPRA